ncbi:type IV secretory system conjugative DNA transfer family protein [Labrenzia sp. MBR-25]
MTFDGQPIFEPDNTSSSLVYAASGGGKTTCVAVPAILSMLADMTRSIVINDVKSGEIAVQLVRLCEAFGRKVAIIDDSYVLGKDNPYRLSVNPFGNLIGAYQSNSTNLMLEIENVSHIFIDEPKDDPKNTYFRQVPREFLELGILILLRHFLDTATPGGLAALLGDPQMWNAAVDREAEDGAPLTRSRARQIKELRENDPEHYSQHYLAALSALRIFQEGSPLQLAGHDADITHETLLKENYIVFLVQNQRNAARLGTYYGLHFNAFVSAQMNGGCGRTDIIFDEAANTPARDMIEKVTIQRAFGLRTLFIAQSRADMQRQNGDKLISMLEDNVRVIQWLKFANIEEAERISRAMGERNTLTSSLNLNSDKLEFSGALQMGRERNFSAEELMRLPDDEQIIYVTGVGFIHCLKVRQNELDPFCHYIDPNPYEGGVLPPNPKIILRAPPSFGGAI